MRTIKFRGKRKDNGEWEYGFYGELTDGYTTKSYIMNNTLTLNPVKSMYFTDYEVVSETVGQYTGLKDTYGTEIYEGDIVKIYGHKYSIKFEIGCFMLVRCSDKTDMYEQFENCWNDDVYPLSQFYWNSDSEEDHLGNCEVIENTYER